MPKTQVIYAGITFLTEAEGGRKWPPIVEWGQYRPHLVVQSLDIRQAVMTGNVLTAEGLA